MKTPNPRSLTRSTRGLFKTLLILGLSMTGVPAQQAGDSPVRIFILAGQSNMLGQGNMTPVTTEGTLEYITAPANDPGGDYQFLVDGGGAWVVRDDVWIKDQDPTWGGLTAGYGSNTGTVGPELGFGHFVGDLYEKQVLIVKAAWGGKSLAVDFRPPDPLSPQHAGPFRRLDEKGNSFQKEPLGPPRCHRGDPRNRRHGSPRPLVQTIRSAKRPVWQTSDRSRRWRSPSVGRSCSRSVQTG